MLMTTFPCVCGGTHERQFRTVNVDVIGPCPEITDDALHVVIPPGEMGKHRRPPYYRIGAAAFDPKAKGKKK